MNKHEKLFKEDVTNKFNDVFKQLFKRYSAKDAAGIVKIAIVDSSPDKKYFDEFLKSLAGFIKVILIKSFFGHGIKVSF